ncbi:MAG: DUF1592 domain-containing protein [Pseudomonadales bacterium]|nr:DUF1592 domain-containing protein [Pseudomonadales bacterium]
MKKFNLAIVLIGSTCFTLQAAEFKSDIQPLLESSCLACHANTVLTPLDISQLSFDLSNPTVFRTWSRVYERLERNEMPPAPGPYPDTAIKNRALKSLAAALSDANHEARGGQRTPLRRLTRLEYKNTMQDLLGIDEALAEELVQSLPAEADSGGFDTVAKHQGISALHIRSYLEAADRALNMALQVGHRPDLIDFFVDYSKSGYLDALTNGNFLGAGITKEVEGGYATFFDTGSTYIFHSATEGYTVPTPGRYRITIEANAYQAKTPVTLTLFSGTKGAAAAAALSDLIGIKDLIGPSPTSLSVETFLRPGDVVSPSVADVATPEGDYVNYYAPENNVNAYQGEGITMRTLRIEGPLLESWPPPSTRKLLVDIKYDASGMPILQDSAYDHILQVVDTFASRAFRRKLEPDEAEMYADLAKIHLENGKPFIDAVRVSLRAILTSPSFLFHNVGSPQESELDDYALATRLAFFLWRSPPDDKLLQAARNGRLRSNAEILDTVERLIDDPKHQRFITDFTEQAFRIDEINATAPDKTLYPEYDERLGQAMVLETKLFFQELIKENLGVANLIKSDFTFLNRRLAEHYRIPDVSGQHMRRRELPETSVRGGLLSQAGIHKITANGTTSSPVPRGKFVLTNLLGQPAPPPPPNIAGLEPDTRGATTVRDQLQKHRELPMCAGCHRRIDPPGIALETFDPIGGYRTAYRSLGDTVPTAFGDFRTYKEGLPVDTSGLTPNGRLFSGFQEYQKILLETELEQVARHLVSQFLVLATGSEVEFIDRDHVQKILDDTRAQGFPVRSLLHGVASSELFRRQ